MRDSHPLPASREQGYWGRMHRPARALLVGTLGIWLSMGCKPPPYPPGSAPPEPPDIPVEYTLQTTEDFQAHQADAVASMRWLMGTFPQDADVQRWKAARNLAMDWAEGLPQPRLNTVAPILDPVVQDRKFIYGQYVRMAYLFGKALYVVEHPRDDAVYDPLELELAAIDAMLEYYGTFRRADPEARSPKLERLARKKRRGKLEGWVAKKLAKQAKG